MKKRITKLLSLVLAMLLVVALVAGCGGSGNNGDTNTPNTGDGDKQPSNAGTKAQLNFSMGDPKTASKTIFYEGLAERTSEATDGGLTVTVHSGGTLFSHFEVCEGVLSGGADMGWFYTPWNPDQYPLTEAIGLPLLFGNQLAATYAVREAYKNTPEVQEELSAFEILNLYSGPINIFFTSFPVSGPSDLQGKQIRSFAGAVTDLLSAWGASPLMIGATEIYDAMDKGTIQGAIYEWSGTKSNVLYEVIDYAVNVPLVQNPFTCIMNKQSYAGIPEEYKATFDEIWAADQTSFDFATMFADENEESHQTGLNDYGIQDIDPDEAMMDLFRPAADDYINNWIAKYSTDNFDAAAYIENLKGWYEEGRALYPDYDL